MRPRILMCPPDFFGIEYEINPWMNRARQVDHEQAKQQWRDLNQLLTSLGVETPLLSPVAGLPDLVFTANAAMIYRQQAIVSRFRHPQRQGEEALDAAWLLEDGFAVTQLPKTSYFEGAGDALFCGETLLAGYHLRSDAPTQQWIGELVGCRVIPLELVDPYYYHLDTCFCPLAPGVAAYFPPAFDEYGQRALRELIADLIPVAAEEAQSFACNAVVVGKHVVTNTGCPGLHAALRQRGFSPVDTPLSEFVKAGGSAKCLTLRLDGEEAAAWKYYP
ncbi:dimethylarginine dimethylaminohydrolase family protein [Lignipirellula cremea]|uniref:N(G),N(G)-dimethylarginine dimethylaminohydrolase n=1 Tax=Lignipirellula cremea TaxID=2528010 RepID=A0A518DPT0_9BACT|nr:arginine deiminase-related protein [Lignipirellula cremea]QDU93838.1 N(G),N(G)-dimethylarginine dimethylaminohydrolase [Lignipirellula cremea]